MPLLKRVVGEMFGKLVFRELQVERCQDLSSRFRRIDLAGSALRGVSFESGDKVQVFIRGDMRTYSPFSFDAERGAFSLLVYLHATETPSTRWARALAPGDRVQVFGPRRALRLSELTGPLILFGDETSFGVARSLAEARGERSADHVFEVESRAEAEPVLGALALSRATLVERAPADGHFPELERALRSSFAASSGATFVLTGRAPAIQFARRVLKQASAQVLPQKVKAYWAPGKRGLD